LIQGEYAAVAEIAKRISELSPARATLLQRSAELLYLSGHAEASLPLFNRVIELTPEQAPDNWQRGIALCTCGQFEAGAEQFKTHHEVNPDDVENSAWYFLCVAKTRGLEDARATVIPSRGDGRQPMMSVLEMLQGKIAPPDVLSAAAANTRPGPARNLAVFYARLYVGLYYDSLGDSAQAIRFLKESLSYESNGYMAHTARVYLSHRFPDSDQTGK
jgi:lipoprotein NlpI